MPHYASRRRFPIGAEVLPNGVGLRIWAPRRESVSVVLEGERREFALEREAGGYFAGVTPLAKAGSRYRVRLDRDEQLYPDPASRFQPEGPHGPSQVVDPHTFRWNDADWPGVTLRSQVIYELHVGTFTPEGTWTAAIERLPHLSDVGISVIEVMPVADFGGTFGWGYDGVNLFAPCRLYGSPDDFRKFVDAAHRQRLGVILDVVYNHFGPDGNYLSAFSLDYFTDRHKTDWGAAINYDGENSGAVREMMIANGAYWIEEFHLDGLRLDATQNVYDSSERHILGEVVQAARQAAGRRSIIVTAENEEQRVGQLAPMDDGGCGIDALWNDDWHHTAIVALTGRAEAYYSDYKGTPQEFVSAAKYGFIYQGQRYCWQDQPRGTTSRRFDPERFVTYLENHDQVANSAGSRRCRESACAGTYRALTAVLLLSPSTPMLFQGQEFGATTPFYFFAGHQPELAALVDVGRKEFLSQFPSQATPVMQAAVPDSSAQSTFERSKLDWSQRDQHPEVLALHRDLLRLRREDPVLSQQPKTIDGAVLSADAFVMRWLTDDDSDRLLLVNLGIDLSLTPCPEPLMAPPTDCAWELAWSSEDPCYGGLGTPAPEFPTTCLPGHSARFFIARQSKA